nr:unnamed protein product [Callosobruchus analis]
MATAQSAQSNRTLKDVPLLAVNAIPVFAGEEAKLPIFLRACNDFLITYYNHSVPEDPLNTQLVRLILTKLEGRALEVISIREDLKSWVAIKELLIREFSDNRSSKNLTQELLRLRIYPNESYRLFAERINKLVYKIATKVQLTDISEEEKRVHIDILNENALTTYLMNLKEPVSTAVKLRDPGSLSEALSLTETKENELLWERNIASLNNTHNFRQNNSNPGHFRQNRPNRNFRPQNQNFNQGYQTNRYQYNRFQENRPNNNNWTPRFQHNNHFQPNYHGNNYGFHANQRFPFRQQHFGNSYGPQVNQAPPQNQTPRAPSQNQDVSMRSVYSNRNTSGSQFRQRQPQNFVSGFNNSIEVENRDNQPQDFQQGVETNRMP